MLQTRSTPRNHARVFSLTHTQPQAAPLQLRMSGNYIRDAQRCSPSVWREIFSVFRECWHEFSGFEAFLLAGSVGRDGVGWSERDPACLPARMWAKPQGSLRSLNKTAKPCPLAPDSWVRVRTGLELGGFHLSLALR